jgi:hypothetical protein
VNNVDSVCTPRCWYGHVMQSTNWCSCLTLGSVRMFSGTLGILAGIFMVLSSISMQMLG